MIDVANSTYAYYVMKNGDNFARKFDKSDELRLIIQGVKDGKMTNRGVVYLAKDGKILDDWTSVDLTPLGEVEKIVFTMESTDKGQWGMNTPAYFCLGSLVARKELVQQ